MSQPKKPDDSPGPAAAGVVVFGEVLLDCFPDGRRVLGGAPFNVAWHLAGLGRRPAFASAVGDDGDGADIRRRMREWGLGTGGLARRDDLATGVVEVSIDAGEPSYEIAEPRAWDRIDPVDTSRCRLLYHGTLALRSPHNRRSLGAMRERADAAVFIDLNLRPPYDDSGAFEAFLDGADWLKLNLGELQRLAGAPGLELASCGDAVNAVRERYSIGTVVLTAGGDGALIEGDYGAALLSPAFAPGSFVDSVGAGDAFAAVTIDGILRGLPAGELVERAGRFAARVCGLRGATPDSPAFYDALNRTNP